MSDKQQETESVSVAAESSGQSANCMRGHGGVRVCVSVCERNTCECDSTQALPD